jgi:hypothetical protein
VRTGGVEVGLVGAGVWANRGAQSKGKAKRQAASAGLVARRAQEGARMDEL